VSIGQVLEKTARELPEKTAVVLGPHRVTYRQLDEGSNRIADALVKLGIRKGDHVALLLPCTPEWILNYFGAVKLGATVVPFDTRMKGQELAPLLRDCDARVLLTEEKFLSSLSPVLEGLLSTEQVIAIDSEPHAKTLKDASPRPPGVEIKDTDDTIIVYTSGVLGKRRGIVHTHEALLSALQPVIAGLELGNNDVLLGLVPFYYLLGLTMTVLAPFMTGATTVILPHFSSKNVLETVEREKVTVIIGVPASYNALARVDEETLKSYNLASLRVAFSAGAKSSAEYMHILEKKFGVTVCEVYGLSEFLAISMGSVRDRKLGTVGRPLCDLKVLDDNGNEVSRGEIGEAVIRAPWVMKGYYKAPELTAQVIKGGWFYTGDLVRIDEQGYVEYVDKKSSIIVTSGGVKINPREVEDILLTHPAVAEAAFVGVLDDYKGQVPTAFIVLKEGQNTTTEEIRNFCRQNLADFKLPKQIKFLNAMPRTESGQVDRLRLRSMKFEK
jgi:long-chain acyl-CoA synthetase